MWQPTHTVDDARAHRCVQPSMCWTIRKKNNRNHRCILTIMNIIYVYVYNLQLLIWSVVWHTCCTVYVHPFSRLCVPSSHRRACALTDWTTFFPNNVKHDFCKFLYLLVSPISIVAPVCAIDDNILRRERARLYTFYRTNRKRFAVWQCTFIIYRRIRQDFVVAIKMIHLVNFTYV